MRAHSRLIALTAALAVLGSLSPVRADYYGIWHRQDGVNQWYLEPDPFSDPNFPDEPLWPPPRWGPERDPPQPAEQLTLSAGPFHWGECFSGYLWVETTWLDEQLVPPAAPTLTIREQEGVRIEPIPGYPYRGPTDPSWIYAWELDPQPGGETIFFPDSDYFHLGNGLASVEVSSLYGIETHLYWMRGTSINAWNRSGQQANDFHIEFDGLDSRRVYSWEDGPYSIPKRVQDTDIGCEVVFDGGTTESGASSHFDLHYTMRLTERLSGAIRWTQDGNTIATLPDVWANYYQMPGEGFDPWGLGFIGGIESRLTNTPGASPETVWIQRSVIPQEFCPGPGYTDWDKATLLDPEPVRLLSGGVLVHRFDDDPFWWYGVAMKYDVFDDDGGRPGQLLATFYDGVLLAPEPEALILLLVGGLSLGGLRMIRRRSRRNSRNSRSVSVATSRR